VSILRKVGAMDSRGDFDFANEQAQYVREGFNINIAWLATIHKLIVVFVDAKFGNDFDTMYEALDSIAMFLYPKMGVQNKEIVDNWMAWLSENKDKWCVRDRNGNIKMINTENRKIIRETFVLVFKEFMAYMETIGILTKEKKDPTLALGNITG